MNFLRTTAGQPVAREQGRGSDATPVRLPPRAQAMQKNALKVQNSIREKYGWQQHPEELRSARPNSNNPRPPAHGQPNSLKRALGLPEEHPADGRFGMIPKPQSLNQMQAPGGNQQAGLIPRSPHLMNKNLNDMNGNSLSQSKIGGFRHVRISSDEFNIHNPLHTGIASPSNRGPSHAVQLFNQKIAMANGANLAGQRRQQQEASRASEQVRRPPQTQQLTNNIRRQISSSDDEDDRMTDMNEADDGARQRLVSQGQAPVMLGRQGGGTAAHAVPSSQPQQRPFNYHKQLDAKNELKERFKVNILRMSKQAPDSEVSASEMVDFSVMEYLNRPAADQDQMALIFRPQMQANEVGGFRKRGETESVMQEETTVFMNLTENRTHDKRPSVHTESKKGLPQHGLGRRVHEDTRKSHQVEAAAGRGDSGDVLVLKRNNQASKNAPTLNSDEMLDVPGFEFKDEMTVLEMQEAEDAEQNQTGSLNEVARAQADHEQAEAESRSLHEFDGLHNLDKSKCSKNKSFNDPDANVQEQEAEDDENDDEILNYSKFSQSKPSNKRNEQVADARDASKEMKDSQRGPTQEAANSSKLDSDPYGLNDRVDSSFLDSKLELKDQEPVGSNKVKNDVKNGAISEKNGPKHVSSSFVDNQLKQEVEHQLYTAKTNKSNVEMHLSGRDLVKSGVVLSSPFILSQDLASDLQVAEGAGAADFEVRPEENDDDKNNEDNEDHASQSKRPSATNPKSENSKDPNSKKSSRQELSDLSIIASQRSQLKSINQVNVNVDTEIKRKCSKIQQRLEAQRNQVEERPRLSNVSDVSRTMTAPKIEGHCKAQDPSRNSQLHKNTAPGEGGRGKALISGEVSMISNNDNVKSTEWNNLKDLNDNPESSNTQRDSNALKTSVQAPFHQQQEAEEIIEENKEEDQANADSQIQLSRQHAAQMNFEQTQPAPEQAKKLKLNIDCLPSERSQANQADYKKFVYSPREQYSLQASEKNQVDQRNEQERQAPERQASSSSHSLLDPMPKQTQMADRPRNQQNETKDELKLAVLGDEGAGKTSIIKYLRQRRQAHGPDDDIALLVNGTPLKVKLIEWKRLDAPNTEDIVGVDGVFVLFDVSDKRTLESAKNNIETLREHANLPLICLAHKFDAIIEMSDKEMAEKGVSEAALASFSSKNSVKVIKTSMKLPRLLDESFQLMLAQATGSKGLPPILNPTATLTNDATHPNQASAPGIQQASIKEEVAQTAAGAQQNELDLAAQNITNIQINTQALPGNIDPGRQAFVESNRERDRGDEDNMLEEQNQATQHQLEIEQAQMREMRANNGAMWERRDSKTRPEAKKLANEISVKAVGKVAATARSARRRMDHSAGRHSIYEHLLNQQVLKQKPSKNKLKNKTGSVASLSLFVNHSGIQKTTEATEGRSPEAIQILGDISLEQKVKEKSKLLKTSKKSLNGAGSRKNSATRRLNGTEEQDQLLDENLPRTDVPGKPVKKKVKRKTYKGIFDTTQRLTKKRNSTQTALNKQGAGRDKEKARDNSSTGSEAIKLNHQRFNQLICQDIAKTRERLKGRQGRLSGPNSEQNTPAKNRSRLTQLHTARHGDLLNVDLAEDGAQNQDDICYTREYCQTAAVPKSQTEAKKNVLPFEENVHQDEDACSPLLPEAEPTAEVKDTQSAKTRTRYLDDAKAYVNIIEGLKQTIADGATHTSVNPDNATTNSNNPLNTRNNGPVDDLGRPSAAGKDTFKYFFQTEQPATETHEFESLIDQPKSNKPLSRGSKTNTSKAGQAVGMFNENILPKFGDQSSISRDASAMNIVLAADASAPLAKDDSPKRAAAANAAHALGQEASKAATRLKQKWKTKTHKKNRNKVADKAGEKASGSPNQTKYHLMSDSKLRSKFQDLMKQNQIKTSINTQRNNVSNSASNKSLLPAKTDQSTAITRLLTKSSSKKSLPGTTIIGDRKFVTKYRDPSLPNPVNTLSSDEQPQIQAIPAPGQHSARDDEAILAQQRQYLKDKKERQAKIKQRIKNIDKLQATDFSVASWNSNQPQEKSHSVEPNHQKEKKNFRDMFTKVKVFEFQSSLAQKKMASPKKINKTGSDHGARFKTQRTPGSKAERPSGGKKEPMVTQDTPQGSRDRGPHLAGSNQHAASQVSECIQERYLTTNDYDFNNYNDDGGERTSMRSEGSNA